jgi:hypothetical protein
MGKKERKKDGKAKRELTMFFLALLKFWNWGFSFSRSGLQFVARVSRTLVASWSSWKRTISVRYLNTFHIYVALAKGFLFNTPFNMIFYSILRVPFHIQTGSECFLTRCWVCEVRDCLVFPHKCWIPVSEFYRSRSRITGLAGIVAW